MVTPGTWPQNLSILMIKKNFPGMLSHERKIVFSQIFSKCILFLSDKKWKFGCPLLRQMPQDCILESQKFSALYRMPYSITIS